MKVSECRVEGKASITAAIPRRRPARSSPRRTSTTASSTSSWDAQDADELVFEDPASPQRFHLMETTEDERFEVLYVARSRRGQEGKRRVRARSIARRRAFAPLMRRSPTTRFHVIDNVGGELLVHTDKDAPNGRIVRIDPDDPLRRTGRRSWQRGPSRSSGPRPPAANCSRSI